MNKNELIFCPLGGSGQIGGNMNLYAYGNEENQKWNVVSKDTPPPDYSSYKQAAKAALNMTDD